jgi:hypothetical protein
MRSTKKSPKIPTGSGLAKIPGQTGQEISPATKTRKKPSTLWPESPCVIRANLTVNLMQEVKDTWLYAKTLTDFREKSGYYKKGVPRVIIHENPKFSV